MLINSVAKDKTRGTTLSVIAMTSDTIPPLLLPVLENDDDDVVGVVIIPCMAPIKPNRQLVRLELSGYPTDCVSLSRALPLALLHTHTDSTEF